MKSLSSVWAAFLFIIWTSYWLANPKLFPLFTFRGNLQVATVNVGKGYLHPVGFTLPSPPSLPSLHIRSLSRLSVCLSTSTIRDFHDNCHYLLPPFHFVVWFFFHFPHWAHPNLRVTSLGSRAYNLDFEGRHEVSSKARFWIMDHACHDTFMIIKWLFFISTS